MYSASTASTTSGSGAGRAGAGERRVRVVCLLRPRRAAPAFGFSLRGGKEYATGFFISKVDFNSEAYLQGLKVGDQIVSVNGYRVDDAVHSELVHYLASQARLKLKVRHVGMLPVKDKAYEALSWQFVSERAPAASEVSSSPTLCHDTDRMIDMRLSILVPPRAKLGCGICKGPEWKPGIFVQFVRAGGIAQEAGLRPGDQILSCNGQDFSNVSFHEAITAMKVSGRLELVIREGAGVELVSPESSGYNSSASSAAGERSPAPASHIPLAPPAALCRRLASVAEEAADRADRLTMNRLKRRTWNSLDFEWKNNDMHNFDAPSDIEPDYDCPSIPNNPHSYENKNLRNKNTNKKDFVTNPSNRTIINLTEDGATIQCSYENQTPRKAFSSSQVNGDGDKKTIVVEVHHTSTAPCNKTHCFDQQPKKVDGSDSTSVSSTNSLSSAIAEEIQRRKMQTKKKPAENIIIPEPPTKTSNVPKGGENDKRKQHDALIDEFKKVHRKMFANQEKKVDDVINESTIDTNATDRQPTLPLRKVVTATAEIENNKKQEREATDIPPPPPPMPLTNGHGKQNGQAKQNGETKQNGEDKTNDSEKNGHKINGTDIKTINFRNRTLTRTPTPDYNGKLDSPVQKLNGKEDKAELDSLESFKLKNPTNVQPKPPSNYFIKAPNGTATMKKNLRPVSVTIGEYTSNSTGRREPSKLDFLNGDKPDGPGVTDDESISNRLQSELVMTLSRSNLRKKTEALTDAAR